jgi:alpha-glucosidase
MMTDNRAITFEESVDPKGLNTNSTVFLAYTRDPARTPFQWDDTRNAGFSNTTGRTWLPVNSNYQTDNLKAQKEANESTFKLYQRLLQARRIHPTLRHGGVTTKAINDNVFGFIRTLAHSNTIAVFVNLRGATTVNLQELMGEEFNSRTRAWVMIADTNSSYSRQGRIVSDVQSIHLDAFSSIVLEVSSASKLALSIVLAFVGILKILL